MRVQLWSVVVLILLGQCGRLSADESHDDDTTTTSDDTDIDNEEEDQDDGSTLDSEHYDSDGHHSDDFDHEKILGSKRLAKEFSQLPLEESRRRLGFMAEKMDVNNDSLVDVEELQQWILTSLRSLDKDSARTQLDEHDENRDQRVSWAEFLHKAYGYTEPELVQFEKTPSDDNNNFIKLIKGEKLKFETADSNKDGFLNLDEYIGFAHPSNYLSMAPFEVPHQMEDFDLDKDGFINLNEFIGNQDLARSIKESEVATFNSFDKDNDGKLDSKEAVAWLVSNLEDVAKREAEHLMVETDDDNDGKLTKKEIVEEANLWVGSHATDYGRHFYEGDSHTEL